MEYKSSKELKGKKLQQGDTLVFTLKNVVLNYDVCKSFLNSIRITSTTSNDTIFTELGLDKMSFCTKAFGYPAKTGDCPECNSNDFDALTRLAMALFKLCEGKKIGKTEKVKPITRHIVLKDSCSNNMGMFNSYEEALSVKPSNTDGQFTIYKLVPVATVNTITTTSTKISKVR